MFNMNEIVPVATFAVEWKAWRGKSFQKDGSVIERVHLFIGFVREERSSLSSNGAQSSVAYCARVGVTQFLQFLLADMLMMISYDINSIEEKIKQLERAVNLLIEESCLASAKGEHKLVRTLNSMFLLCEKLKHSFFKLMTSFLRINSSSFQIIWIWSFLYDSYQVEVWNMSYPCWVISQLVSVYFEGKVTRKSVFS